jgi:hypothetical protein
MDLGDRIQRAWRSFVRRAISADGLSSVIDEIDWTEMADSDPIYFYVVIGKRHGEPVVDEFDGPMASDFFVGAGASKLVAAIPAHEGMTKQDLLDFDVAEDSAYWDHPEWSDG